MKPPTTESQPRGGLVRFNLLWRNDPVAASFYRANPQSVEKAFCQILFDFD
jgi:hypothetical protein